MLQIPFLAIAFTVCCLNEAGQQRLLVGLTRLCVVFFIGCIFSPLRSGSFHPHCLFAFTFLKCLLLQSSAEAHCQEGLLTRALLSSPPLTDAFQHWIGFLFGWFWCLFGLVFVFFKIVSTQQGAEQCYCLPFNTHMLSWEEGKLIWFVCVSALCQYGLAQLTRGFSNLICFICCT